MEERVTKEITEAIKALGYKETPEILNASPGRYKVYVGSCRIGIWDDARHTFID